MAGLRRFERGAVLLCRIFRCQHIICKIAVRSEGGQGGMCMPLLPGEPHTKYNSMGGSAAFLPIFVMQHSKMPRYLSMKATMRS